MRYPLARAAAVAATIAVTALSVAAAASPAAAAPAPGTPAAGPPALCVPKTPSTSCDQAIFVDRAAGESLSSDAVVLYFDWFG